MPKTFAAITAMGGYVPEYILDNEELSRMVDTTDEWIMSRVGIKTRHILKDPTLGSSYLGIKACENLLERHPFDINEVDALLCATTTPDHFFPSTASKICEGIGLKTAFAFDIEAACSGFITALTIASTYIESGRYKKILVVAAEKMSFMTDYTDRQTCPLFGDGAAAALIEPNTEGLGIIDYKMHTDGVGFPFLHMKSGGSVSPASHETVERREHFVYQEGRAVYKHAVTDMSQVCIDILKANNLTGDDVNWLVPHQANLRIIDAVLQRAGIKTECALVNIQRYGNTSGASIPLCLWDYIDKFKKGDNIILAAFGAGFIWGAVYIKWAV
ncbi:MAG: ketoacyl-ACP synthase III [Paludibacteraceae bacterium]|nr:ketoacyl-ACP synthase III [Paludibacteraceae bacterium]